MGVPQTFMISSANANTRSSPRLGAVASTGKRW